MVWLHNNTFHERSLAALMTIPLPLFAMKVILHVAGEDPVLGELEAEPQTTDNFIKLTNLRRVDGKDIAYLTEGVDTVIFPWNRVTFLEFLPGGSDSDKKVIGFFR
jgi:hypothetical protein